MNENVLEPMLTTGRWHSRPVTYWGGQWRQLRGQIPQFKIDDFRVSNEAPSNPYMKSVVRQPRTSSEKMIPVGVVSNTYTLVQHDQVVEKCFEAFRKVKIDPDPLRCELGLTELGEWMTIRVFFPDRFSYTPNDGQRLDLCLECASGSNPSGPRRRDHRSRHRFAR